MSVNDKTGKFEDIVSTFTHLSRLINDTCDENVRSKISEFNQMRQHIVNEHLQLNALYVDKLKEMYIDIYRMIFNCDADEQLKNLLEIYLEIYPMEAQHILKYISVYKFSTISSEKSILLKGDIQSGKTAMMILTAMMYLICNRDVVLILRNKDDDKKQFKQRFYQFVDILKQRNYTHKNFKIIDKHDKPETHACLFIDLYRKENIKKIIKKLKGRYAENAVVYIDEADTRDDEIDIEFIELCELVGTKIFVSATVQDILVSQWKITGGNIIPLFQSHAYRGIDKLDFIIKHKDDLLPSLIDICNTDNFQSSYHPKITLIQIERSLSFILNLFEFLTKNQLFIHSGKILNLPSPVCVIQYTGDGISLFHHTLRVEELKTEFTVKKFTNQVAVLGKRNASVKNVLLWLRRNGGKERFPHIVILAGDMASRGINFACYETDTTSWHITHQILFKSSASTSASVVQSLRILGNHGDDIPLTVYTTEKLRDTILSAYQITMSMIDCIVNTENKFNRSEYTQLTTDEICKVIPIYKKDIPRKFLARKILKEALNLVSDFNSIHIPDTEDKNSDTEDNDKQLEGTILFITKDRLKEHQTAYYDLFVNTMIDKNILNQWVSKIEFIRQHISVNKAENEAEKINNSTWHWINHARVVENEDECNGLLFKKYNNLYYVRYNSR